MFTQGKPPLHALLPTLLFLLPLFFLPFTLNFFATNKQALLVVFSLLALALTALQVQKTKNLALPSSPLLLPLGLFTLAVLLNILVIKEGSLEALANRGSLLIALSLLSALILSSPGPKKLAKNALSAIILASSLLSVHGILQLTYLYMQTYLPTWMQNQSFTPAGSPLILLSLLVPTLVATLILAFKVGSAKHKTLYLIAGGIQLSASLAYISLILTSDPFNPLLLPLGAGWSLALDALKTGKSFLLGVGLANFPSLFTSSRPLSLNQSDIWPIVQQASSNEFFQILATTGLLGFGSFILLLLKGWGESKKLTSSPENLALKGLLSAVVISFLLIPANILSYSLFFIFLALLARQNETGDPKNYHLGNNLRLSYIVLVLTFATLVGYAGYKLYRAEFLMRRAQLALGNNQAQVLYDSLTEAITLVPRMTSYHTSFSQVNLTLASSLSQKESLSDQDRQQITILVQRAIEEARIAAQLRPTYFSTWQNLGQVYRNLINVAEGAEQFAIDYYAQAVNLNPASPTLRVDYGGLFYQLAQVSEDQATRAGYATRAASQFQTAIQLRPSYANAHYNLGKTLEMVGNIQGAITSLETALSHLSPDSPDYAVAASEIASLKAQLAETQVVEPEPDPEPEIEGEELSTPDPLPSPIPGGEIILDSDL